MMKRITVLALLAAILTVTVSMVLAQSSTFCNDTAAAGVALFDLPGCEMPGNKIEFFQPGDFNLTDSSELANRVSSTLVASGWSIRVYSESDQGGNTHCLIPGTMWDLSLDNWPGTDVPMGDDIESVKVFDNGDCQP